jgi:hypothetical protein
MVKGEYAGDIRKNNEVVAFLDLQRTKWFDGTILIPSQWIGIRMSHSHNLLRNQGGFKI